MKFSLRKLSHLFALFLLLFVLFIIYISPLISLISTPSGNSYRITELTLLLNSLFLTALLIGVPIIWLMIVDGMSVSEVFRFLRLKRENIDKALLFGLVAFVVIFLLHVFMVAIITLSGIKLENPIGKEIISKISIPSMLIMFSSQSMGEEVFFRGFFMRKFEQKTDTWIAIVIVSILFGLAHLGYGEVYQIIMPIAMGLILGYLVVKTDNLFSSITAHVLFNVFIFMIALAAKTSLTL